MRPSRSSMFAAATLVAVATSAFAQGGTRAPRQGPAVYDVATEVTLTGTVDTVQTTPAPARGPGGLHLMLRTDTGVIDVHLGPAAFVTSKQFAFAKGDAVVVTGSNVQMGGSPVVLARQVTKDGKVLTLRDPKGFPLWSGRGRR